MVISSGNGPWNGRRPGERIVDIRPLAEFVAGHLPGAVAHPVSAPSPGSDAASHFEAALPSIFLPPREVPLLVTAARDDLARALAEHLTGRGRVDVRALGTGDLPPEALSEVGASCGHLWSAPLWLEAHAGLLPPPAAGRVLDLGCGSGRAAVWLAERGYRVTAVDWQEEALALGYTLAASRGVNVDFRAADLREPAAVPAGPWSVIVNFRYLQRDLLPRFASLLQPAGVACVRTFRDAPGYSGGPQPRHRLVAGELLGFFPRGRFEILAHETSHDPDGRPAAGIVARRVTSAG